MILSSTFILGLLFLLSAPLPSASARAQTQVKTPSAATLIEQARILAEEKADPKAAITLLVDKILCRSDLTKAQFAKAAKMIAVYGGGKPPALSAPSAEAPLPRQDLVRLIEKEIDAYLADQKQNSRNITWFKSAAFPVVLRRLKRDYIKPGVASRLVPLILSSLDPGAAATFLEELRERGPQRFKEIVAESFSVGLIPRSREHDVTRLRNEVLTWIRSWKPEQRSRFSYFLSKLEPDELVALLDEKQAVWKPVIVVSELARRSVFVRLKDPSPLFRAIREAARRHETEKRSRVGGKYLAHWLLRQEGGFEVLASTVGCPALSYDLRNPDPFGGVRFVPDVETGLAAFLSGMHRWGENDQPDQFLFRCLDELWRDPIDKPSPELQGILFQIMEILDKAQKKRGSSSGAIWNRIMGTLLLRVSQADPEFQVELWQKAMTSARSPYFLLPVSRGTRPPVAALGPVALLLREAKGGEAVLPGSLSLDRRIELFLRFVAMGNWHSFAVSFRGSRLFVPYEGVGQRLIEAIVALPDLVPDLLDNGGMAWWPALSKEKSRSVLAEILGNPKVKDRQLYGLLGVALDEAEHPVDLVEWVRSVRKDISPFLLCGIRSPDQKLVYSLLDLILAHRGRLDELDGNSTRFAQILRPYPSRKGRAFLGRMLLSDNKGTQGYARQILDDWQRLEDVQGKREQEQLKAALWRKLDSDHGVAARMLALKGLFDLGEKKAWLVLTDWIESKDVSLKKAAEQLAAEIRSGK